MGRYRDRVTKIREAAARDPARWEKERRAVVAKLFWTTLWAEMVVAAEDLEDLGVSYQVFEPLVAERVALAYCEQEIAFELSGGQVLVKRWGFPLDRVPLDRRSSPIALPDQLELVGALARDHVTRAVDQLFGGK